MLGILHTGCWQGVVPSWQDYSYCQMWEFTSRGHRHLSRPQPSQTINLKCLAWHIPLKSQPQSWGYRAGKTELQRFCQLCSSSEDTVSCLQKHLVPPALTKSLTSFSFLCYKLSDLQTQFHTGYLNNRLYNFRLQRRVEGRKAGRQAGVSQEF